MKKLLEHLTLSNYRGFKEEQILNIAGPGNFTFLIGQNNSGKSLISRAFSFFNGSINNYYTGIDISDKEYYNIETTNIIQLKLGLNNKFFQNINNQNLSKLFHFLKAELSIEFAKKDKHFRMLSLIGNNSKSHNLSLDDFKYSASNNSNFNSKFQIEEITKIIEELYKYIAANILIFNSIRSFEINSNPINANFVTGKNLIDWYNVDKDNKDADIKKKCLQSISKYLKRFNLDAPVDIKVNHEKLCFTFDNYLTLTSDEVGTGYTMLVILFTEIIRNNKEIIIIDEIESHLQPGMIRTLLEILRENTNIQYIISSHSSTVIECAKEDDYLFRFYKNNGACYITPFSKYGSISDYKIQRSLANELGIIPGDALLSNVVIWVEGPTDILWIRAWLKNYLPLYLKKNKLDFNIIEGLHYSILITAGSLIAHESFTEEIENNNDDPFSKIKLLRINPHPILIIDSDNADGEKKKRILRIAKEIMEHNKSFDELIKYESIYSIDIYEIDLPNMWIFKGKEIENYCHPQLLMNFLISKNLIGNDFDIKNINLFDTSHGIGEILFDYVPKISKASGTLNEYYKNELAKFVYQNFTEIHFKSDSENIASPSIEMLEDLTKNLDKIFNYIAKMNKLI